MPSQHSSGPTSLTHAAFSMGGWKPPWMQRPSTAVPTEARHSPSVAVEVGAVPRAQGYHTAPVLSAPTSAFPGVAAAAHVAPTAPGLLTCNRAPATLSSLIAPPNRAGSVAASGHVAVAGAEVLAASNSAKIPRPVTHLSVSDMPAVAVAPLASMLPETKKIDVPPAQREVQVASQPWCLSRTPGPDPAFFGSQPATLNSRAHTDPGIGRSESTGYVFELPSASEAPQKASRRNSNWTSSLPKGDELPPLSPQQQLVVQMILQKGQSVFFTGSAGTGKSRTLKEIVKQAPTLTTKVTALTGIASSILPGGTTLHSFAGIGLAKGSQEQILTQLKSNHSKVKMWKQLKLLIVDEASMMSKKLFEVLEYVARKVRGNEKPFGGVQLCLCGDFFQLPPVARGGGDDGKFCFESSVWDKCISHSIELTTVYRQRDQTFLRLLREVRFNAATQESINLLQSLSRPLDCPPGIQPTRLYPVNAVADRINAEELSKLPGSTYMFPAHDSGPEHLREQLNNLTMFPKVLELKVGAQVMMLKNSVELVNGSRGVVIDFVNSGMEIMPQIPKVRWMSGNTTVISPDDAMREVPMGKLTRRQLPLKLCWAMTIHKSQGMSIDLLEVDLARVFEKGQAYVALSRARTLQGLRVCSFDPSRFWVDLRVVDFYRNQVKPVEEVC